MLMITNWFCVFLGWVVEGGEECYILINLF